MRKATDTTLRFIALLQRIPVYPKKKSTTDLQRELRNQNAEFGVDLRSIQRDLEKLSAVFPISCEQQGRTYYWFWLEDHSFTQIPAMNKSTALTFKLAAEYLKPLMPRSASRLLEPYFKYASEILRPTKLGKWPAKVRIIGRGPDLIAPAIKPEVQDVVYEALLEDKQFEVDYRGKGQGEAKRQTLNPLGLVSRGGIVYLVATLWNYQDPLHYALHRMRRAKLLTSRANPLPGFDLAHYIEEEKGFSYPVSGGEIRLCAMFTEDAALHLRESKLSDDQKVTEKIDGWVLVEATVADTAELRWWLLGFGELVEVLGPKALRREFVGMVEGMKKLYEKSQ